MLARIKSGHMKSIAKTISYRLVGAAESFAISFFLTGSLSTACGMVGFETVARGLIYYAHERAWG
jgi:uncharacterized membrane protein